MALSTTLTIKGTQYPNAHIEIVSAFIDRGTKTVRLEYLLFATRSAATQDFIGNALKHGYVTLPFAGLGAALSSFYSALHDKLLEQYPTASQAVDAAP